MTPFQQVLLKEAGRKVTVRMDGATQEATLEEVLARKLTPVASEGLPHALGHVTRSINEAQRLKQAHDKMEIELGNAAKERLKECLAETAGEGADPIWVTPHPDDVVIVEGEDRRFNGPIDEEGLKPIRKTIAHRDTLLMQSVLDERLTPRNDRCQAETSYVDEPGSISMVLAFLLNSALPIRFRLSENEIMFQVTRHERLTTRELLKAARKAWAYRSE